MRTGLPKQKKTTDIWFDEKDPLIHIRTHNTDLKKRLAAYAEQHPDVCRQTDAVVLCQEKAQIKYALLMLSYPAKASALSSNAA